MNAARIELSLSMASLKPDPAPTVRQRIYPARPVNRVAVVVPL
jgi:hypothetical protein